MPDIDFLPTEYRHRLKRRRSQPWRIILAAALIGMLLAAAITQNYQWRRVRADLAKVTTKYIAAINARDRLTEVQRQLEQVRACAELYTYLRHPWPRTQLLTAIIEPLPNEITLQQVQVMREPADASAPANARPPVDAKAQESSSASHLPAQRDLAKLRDRMEPTRTTMILNGTAAGSSALYRYLSQLDAAEIFERTELDWFDSVDGGRSLRFQVVLGVQPGYGQLGGPTRSGIRSKTMIAPTKQPTKQDGKLPHRQVGGLHNGQASNLSSKQVDNLHNGQVGNLSYKQVGGLPWGDGPR